MPNRISHLWAIVLAVLAVAFAAEAQTTPRSDCPTIRVDGPAGIVDSDPFKFKVRVEGKLRGQISYRWSVSKGQIIDGQGTAEVTVLDAEGDGSLTGTVEVIGLPKGCLGHASETTPPREYVHPVLIDEVEQPITKFPEQTLRIVAEEQKNNPSNNLYIIAYYDKNISQFDVRQGVKKVSNFLIKEMKLTANHFEIEVVRSDTNSVKIYRLPPGAEKPTPR